MSEMNFKGRVEDLLDKGGVGKRLLQQSERDM